MPHSVLNFLAFPALFFTFFSVALAQVGASDTKLGRSLQEPPSSEIAPSARDAASTLPPPIVVRPQSGASSTAAPASTPAYVASAPVSPQPQSPASTQLMANDFNKANQPPVDIFARFAAIVGVLLAVINFSFTFYKMLRDRHLSIEDDFWFRKIISPTTIEPLLKTITEILEKIPTATSTADEKKEFAIKVTTKFQSIGSSMQTLALLYPELPDKVICKLRACEDTLTDYAASISNNVTSEIDQSLDALRLEVWRKTSNALEAVRDEQLRHTFSLRKLVKAKYSKLGKNTK